jgi:hypothetical protein
MISFNSLRAKVEELRDNLESGTEVEGMLEKENSLAVATLVGEMADLAAMLMQNVTNFFRVWDFEEDCRKGREKEAAAEAAER